MPEAFEEPLDFIEGVLNFKPYQYQADFITGCNTNNRVVGLFSRQSGKTTCCAAFCVWYSVTHTEKNVLIFAPTQQQSEILFKKISDYFRYNKELKWIVSSMTTSQIVLNQGTTIQALTVGDYGETKRGFTADLIIEEEASFIKDSIDSQVIMPMIASKPDAIIIKIGTPHLKGHFYRSAYGQSSPYKLFAFDYSYPQDCGLYAPGFIDEYKITHTEADFRTEFGLEFIEGTDSYFRDADVLGNITPHPTGQIRPDLNYYLGVDIARYGEDDTALVIVEESEHPLHPHKVFHVEHYNGKPVTWTIGRIKELHSSFNFRRIMVDETGMGAGPVDLLKEQAECPVEGITFTNQSKYDLYSNLTVLFEKRHLTIPNHRLLIAQLLDLRKEVTSQCVKIHHPDGGHDDLCFAAGTLVLTVRGQVPIEKLHVGDWVRTRDGFHRIVAVNNRMAEVITRFGLTGTPEHPVLTTDGIKKLINISASDLTYIWNEKQSCIMVRPITDTPTPNADNIDYITGLTRNGKKPQSHCIGRYGLTIMAQHLKDIWYTIKTTIQTTTRSQILNSCPGNSMLQYIPTIQSESKLHDNLWPSMPNQQRSSGISQKPVENSIRISERYHGKIANPQSRHAYCAIKNFSIIPDNNQGSSAPHHVGKSNTELNTNNSGFAHIAKDRLSHMRIQKSITARYHARRSIERVYNIKVEGKPEYFANNILVHNCDALVLAAWPLKMGRKGSFHIA